MHLFQADFQFQPEPVPVFQQALNALALSYSGIRT